MIAFSCNCLNCGTEVEFGANSRPGGREQRAVVRCPECKRVYKLVLSMELVVNDHRLPGEDNRAQCGTNSGYLRHRKEGTVPCGACMDAHARESNPTGKKIPGFVPWDVERKARVQRLREVQTA